MFGAITNFGLSDPWKGLIDKYSLPNARVRPTVHETVCELSSRENAHLQLVSLIERIEKVADWQSLQNLSFLHDLSQLAVTSCSLEPIAQDPVRLNRLLAYLVTNASLLFAEQLLARFQKSSYPTKISLHVSTDALETVELIRQKFPYLTGLVLVSVERERLWYAVFQKCRHLTRLELSATSFSQAWYSQVELPETVQELILSGIVIDDKGLQNMLARAKSIFRLELQFCPQLTCEGVNFPQTLKSFIAQSIPIGDKGLVNLASSCYALETLRLVACLSLPDTAFEQATFTSDITYLYLASVPMSQKGLTKLLTYCERLRQVHLWDCRGVSSLVNSPFPASIIELSLTSFPIDHLSLQHVLDCCPKLENLIVEECKSVDLAKVSFPPTLTALGLARVNLTDSNAERIVTSCNKLQKVFFTCCEGLSKSKAAELCDRVAKPSLIGRLSSLFTTRNRQG